MTAVVRAVVFVSKGMFVGRVIRGRRQRRRYLYVIWIEREKFEGVLC